MTGEELLEQLDLEPSAVLAIIREEAPHVLELAVRRAVIERQRQLIEQLVAAANAVDEPPVELR